jgi:hypothetical protein
MYLDHTLNLRVNICLHAEVPQLLHEKRNQTNNKFAGFESGNGKRITSL